jgi:carbamoyl-phosphate synthase large subunit
MSYMDKAVEVSNDAPVLLDQFLGNAVEVDVDAICDGTEVVVGGIMQHIEQAGIHSGDSACSLPPYNIEMAIQERIKQQTRDLALALKVVGLMNIQFAIRGEEIYILEVNPRASRTVPFVSKAIGKPLAKIAARCMVGQTLTEQGFVSTVVPEYFSVKEAVFPFLKFSGVDPILGPEMKSTGEVMGVGRTYAEAFAKSQRAAGVSLPLTGVALISVCNDDKGDACRIGAELIALGFALVATEGTADFLVTHGVDCGKVNKVRQGRPHIVDMIIDGQIDLIINTTEGKQAIADSFTIRREALQHRICYTTTMSGAWSLRYAIEEELSGTNVYNLRELHESLTH